MQVDTKKSVISNIMIVGDLIFLFLLSNFLLSNFRIKSLERNHVSVQYQ